MKTLEEMEEKLLAALRQLNSDASCRAIANREGRFSNRALWKLEIVALLAAISELKQRCVTTSETTSLIA